MVGKPKGHPRIMPAFLRQFPLREDDGKRVGRAQVRNAWVQRRDIGSIRQCEK